MVICAPRGSYEGDAAWRLSDPQLTGERSALIM